jgi:transcriptional repressor NrdR
MKCPFCSDVSSKVVDKRQVSSTDEIRRRRECLKCGGRFTTYEHVSNAQFTVIKKDGRREPFNRLKLQSGIKKALEKRPFAEKAETLTLKIEKKIWKKGVSEITSRQIGKVVLAELKKVDSVAYLRFASVYRQFEDPNDFARELKNIN